MNFLRRPLVAGAAALFVAGLANRIIGTIYRILLVRTAGEEVVGLMQMTWPVYRVAWVLATAGICVAVTRLTADARGSGYRSRARTFGKIGLVLTIVTSLLSGIFLFATRHLFANHFLTDPRTITILTLFPLLLIPSALSHTLRGILQGEERLKPVAASSVIEAVGRVPVVLILVTLLIPLGPGWAAGGIALGLAAGEIISLAYLSRKVRKTWKAPGASLRYWIQKIDRPALWTTTGALTAVAAPVLLSGLMNGILGMFNVALIPRQLLTTGMDAAEATIVYGRLFGMALPILYMPMVAIHPLAHAVVPAVARRLAEGQFQGVRRLFIQCLSIAIAVSLGAAFLFWNYGEQLGTLLYRTSGLGSLIAPLAFAAPFAYAGHIASGVLYGLGRTGIAMMNTVIGSVVRLGVIYALVGDPRWGIVGALWAVVVDFALTALLDVTAVIVFMRRPDKTKS